MIFMLFFDSCNENIKPWSVEEVNNLCIELIDDIKIEGYSFAEDRIVIAVEGTKNSYICEPVYEWKIDKDGNLFIYDQDIDIEIALKKLRKSDKIIEVLRNG